MQASVVIRVSAASIWRPWCGRHHPGGTMSGIAGDTGHAGHLRSVAELAVAAASDDLPVPQNDDLVHLVEAV
jgi:hypothetical protein